MQIAFRLYNQLDTSSVAGYMSKWTLNCLKKKSVMKVPVAFYMSITPSFNTIVNFFQLSFSWSELSACGKEMHGILWVKSQKNHPFPIIHLKRVALLQFSASWIICHPLNSEHIDFITDEFELKAIQFLQLTVLLKMFQIHPLPSKCTEQ